MYAVILLSFSDKQNSTIIVIFSFPAPLHMISQVEMKGIYSNALIWIEEAFWGSYF